MTRSNFGSVEYVGPDYYRVWWTDKSGRRRSHRMPNTTRDEAETYLAMRKLGPMEHSTTWGQFWRARVEPQVSTLAVKSRDEYRRQWRRYLSPVIADERVCEMDWHRANSVIGTVEAPSMQRAVGRLLKKMCNMAIREGLLSVNPVDRAIEYRPHRRRRKKIVDAARVRGVMEAARGCKYEPVVLCLMGFGMRPEEADALTWEDIRPYELKGSTYCVATVDKALTWTTSEGKHLKSTKNEPSEREAVCGEPFASRLLELAEGMSGPLCPSGEPYDPDAPEAWYTSPNVITRNWAAWCERHGLECSNQKDFRSSYATMMGEAMVPDSVVAGNMGHSDGTTKGDNYQRVTMRAKCMAADMLADLIAELE